MLFDGKLEFVSSDWLKMFDVSAIWYILFMQSKCIIIMVHSSCRTSCTRFLIRKNRGEARLEMTLVDTIV